MHYLEEDNKKIVVIVGIPGVGKTTVISKTVEMLKSKGVGVTVSSFGSVMLEEAKKKGAENRDDIRKLSVDQQKEIQSNAARDISSINDSIVIVDTHAFIATKEGFYPGLPRNVLEEMNPDSFVLISARPEEIYSRRMKDTTRERDIISIDKIKKDLDVSIAMLSSCSVFCGSPMNIILNTEGKIDEAANSVVTSLGFNDNNNDDGNGSNS